MRLRIKYVAAFACFLSLFSLLGAEKVVITKADQLPRVAYAFEGNVVELFNDREALREYFDKAQAEILDRLERFDIQDKATVRGYYGNLRTFDVLEGNYEAALKKIELIRSLLEKPADKLTSNLITESLLKVWLEKGDVTGEELVREFRKNYAAKVKDLPWDVVQDELEGVNGTYQIVSEALYMGRLSEQMQVTVDRTGELGLEDVTSLANLRYMIDEVLPVKEAIVAVTSDYIAANRVEKPDIWADRDVDISGMENLTPVTVAIWDSGVDATVFEPLGKMWRNHDEVRNGEDDDGNGWVDDIYGVGWDLDSYRTTEDLYPLTEEQLAEYPEQLDFTKGLLDLQAAIDSEEAAATRQRMANLKQEDYKPFVEKLGLYGNYTHGTHVAGIAAKGNPAIQLMNVRITFGHELIPQKPTLAKAVRSANEAEALGNYLKANGVRIVNMSWGGSQAGWEYALEANGIGDSPEHRADIARILFGIGYDALYGLMRDAPEILFVPSAGNSDSDVEFNKVIPSSIDLPNVLVVGAVDQAGDETGFTSYGRNVRVHANGFEVESPVPGGRLMKFSGTSMSSPNVTNLAAKLLAIDPSLTPVEVIRLIEMGIETTEDGRRFLIHPKKSIELLKVKNSL